MWWLLACAAPPEPAPPPPLGASLPKVEAPAPAAARAEPPSSTRRTSAAGRVVAVGDLHGDPAATRRAFELAGLVDAAGKWTGGTATLVQTGDVTDRGPDSKGVLAFLRDLGPQAEAAGGAVIALLGNHEVMNTRGDWRYVSDADLAGYGGEAARRAAFAKDGADGAWLATLDAVAIVDDTLFCHGGLREAFAKLGTDAVNQQIRAAMFDPALRPPVIGDAGPMWYRGYAQDPEADVCGEAERALAAVGARRMVVGHTVQEDGRVNARCGGRIVLIDTGNSAHYGDHAAAFEVVAGDARALYASGAADLVDPPGDAR